MKTDELVPLGIVHTDDYDDEPPPSPSRREELIRRVERGVCHEGWEIELWNEDWTRRIDPQEINAPRHLLTLDWVDGESREDGSHPQFPGLEYYCDVTVYPAPAAGGQLRPEDYLDQGRGEWENMFCGGRAWAEMRALPAGPRIPLYRRSIKGNTWNILVRRADLNRAWTEICALKIHPTDEMIREAIKTVYDEADATGAKPPNVNQATEPVRNVLFSKGRTATRDKIRLLLKEPEFKQRRRPPGKTIASETLHN